MSSQNFQTACFKVKLMSTKCQLIKYAFNNIQKEKLHKKVILWLTFFNWYPSVSLTPKGLLWIICQIKILYCLGTCSWLLKYVCDNYRKAIFCTSF